MYPLPGSGKQRAQLCDLHISFLPLFSPGIAVDKNGLIYFVDGTVIRKVDQNGIISTLLGSNDLASARPLSCDSVMDVHQVKSENCSNLQTQVNYHDPWRDLNEFWS